MFTYFGHNCFLFETDSNIFLIDPWFSRKGAFFGSWFQYPPNHQYGEDIIKLSKNKKLVLFVTHEHLDHFDIDFITQLDISKVREIIPDVSNQKK